MCPWFLACTDKWPMSRRAVHKIAAVRGRRRRQQLVQPPDNSADRDPEATEVLSLSGTTRGRGSSLSRWWSRVREHARSREAWRYLPHAGATAAVIAVVIAVVIVASGRGEGSDKLLAASDGYETRSAAEFSADIDQLRAAEVASEPGTPQDIPVPLDGASGDSSGGDPIPGEGGTDDAIPTSGDVTGGPAPDTETSTPSPTVEPSAPRSSFSISASASASASFSAQVTARPEAPTTITVVVPPTSTSMTVPSATPRPSRTITATTSKPAPPTSTPPRCTPQAATSPKKTTAPSTAQPTGANPPTKTPQSSATVKPSSTTAKPSATTARPCG
ncbi:hypothetical protein DFR76_102825 [Nocardia pseudobrasiliensis]|uniref:Uncharacterized protein n=1 Tax=Nocardia pseudobrasiliensis TaxID=45979 RepID=A0A370IG40_9NOCA|nr:hypothetical protein DFR76_102825 [Nocardia pseudobrasiliensis]